VEDAHRLRLATDLAPSRWLVEHGIGAYEVPAVFEAYVRILHPASSAEGEEDVPWAQVAEWAGRELHAGSTFEEISKPRGRQADAPWEEPPEQGGFPRGTLPHLLEVLAAHTGTADRCWFCLWDGYGWLYESAGTSSVVAFHGEGTPPVTDPDPVRPTFEGVVEGAPKVALPTRDYLLLTGPLEAAEHLGGASSDFLFFPQSPNIFWPDDRAWCAATEIDLDSTCVGGSVELVEAIVADPAFEAFRLEGEAARRVSG
jgi:hypothetical protein